MLLFKKYNNKKICFIFDEKIYKKNINHPV